MISSIDGIGSLDGLLWRSVLYDSNRTVLRRKMKYRQSFFRLNKPEDSMKRDEEQRTVLEDNK